MDVICAQCGEPWDYYGIHHGDMEPQEIKPFLKGQWCPCCKDKPERRTGRFLEQHFYSLMDATDDTEELMDSLPDDAF